MFVKPKQTPPTDKKKGGPKSNCQISGRHTVKVPEILNVQCLPLVHCFSVRYCTGRPVGVVHTSWCVISDVWQCTEVE